jgi:hypothetical protein
LSVSSLTSDDARSAAILLRSGVWMSKHCLLERNEDARHRSFCSDGPAKRSQQVDSTVGAREIRMLPRSRRSCLVEPYEATAGPDTTLAQRRFIYRAWIAHLQNRVIYGLVLL